MVLAEVTATTIITRDDGYRVQVSTLRPLSTIKGTSLDEIEVQSPGLGQFLHIDIREGDTLFAAIDHLDDGPYSFRHGRQSAWLVDGTRVLWGYTDPIADLACDTPPLIARPLSELPEDPNEAGEATQQLDGGYLTSNDALFVEDPGLWSLEPAAVVQALTSCLTSWDAKR